MIGEFFIFSILSQRIYKQRSHAYKTFRHRTTVDTNTSSLYILRMPHSAPMSQQSQPHPPLLARVVRTRARAPACQSTISLHHTALRSSLAACRHAAIDLRHIAPAQRPVSNGTAPVMDLVIFQTLQFFLPTHKPRLQRRRGAVRISTTPTNHMSPPPSVIFSG